ncbi:hypothetical protein PR202_gb24562 [Eleusine coracana subsp. coracana]|uniref:Transcription repressor n=1 Tax=Eleusine coracana subsp. coracana TaxID=191504 RepID=A0AAV5FIZ2_ELECO|nr:hypothetical protein QOZ80_5BG0449840 [Eleusine coracana subsp. coracana]GJN35758.1 hypothetical protein PR202_gb24562 [Eleusine coracana subsp. coracana]
MDSSSRSGGRRLKDRLARLLRPANSLLRASCSSSSATSTAFTTTPAATTTISPTSSTSTTAANYTTTAGAMLPRAEPFSAALDRLRHPPPPERVHINNNKAQPLIIKEASSSSRHGSRRHTKNKNVIDSGGVRTLYSNPYGFTTTSSDEEKDDDDADDESAAFFSTRSLLSSDASVFYRRKHHHPPPNTNKRRRRPQRRRRRRRRPAASCVDTCGGGASEPGFRPLVMAAAEEEVRKGLAVVKRSRDPYGDFRESMVQVIVGRQVFGAAELEGLLDSYMALNAPCLHPVILQAFSDIWLVLHGGG